MTVGFARATLPRFEMTIGGEALSADKWMGVIDPATEKPWAEVPQATASDVDRAVAAANAAFGEWSAWPIDRRHESIKLYLDAIEERAEDFARILQQSAASGSLRWPASWTPISKN